MTRMIAACSFFPLAAQMLPQFLRSLTDMPEQSSPLSFSLSLSLSALFCSHLSEKVPAAGDTDGDNVCRGGVTRDGLFRTPDNGLRDLVAGVRRRLEKSFAARHG